MLAPRVQAAEAVWVKYPHGLRLARVTYQGETHCLECGVEPGKYHREACNIEMCPKCLGRLTNCGCNDPGRLERLYSTLSEKRRRINVLAAKYCGCPMTIEIGSNDPDVLTRKLEQFENMVAMATQARRIKALYLPSQLRKMKEWRQLPRRIVQANILEREAYKLWLDWFYK